MNSNGNNSSVVSNDGDSDDEFSDDEMWNNMDFGAFDLIEIGEREQNIIQRANLEENDADDDLQDDLPLFYHAPEFTWTREPYLVRCRSTFAKNPGPVKLFDIDTKATQYFSLFYTNAMFEKIVEFTNMNAMRKRTTDPGNNRGVWYNVTVEEIKAYYGVLILMDVITCDRDELYWSQSTDYPYIRTEIPKIFSRDRFMQIRRYLHFSDDSNVDQTDKLFKFRYMIDNIGQAFKEHYVPHEHISVDEAMIPFKGRLSFKQYMKDKPVKFGIKMWVLADAVTAYCHNFDIYVGRFTQGVNRFFGLSGQVVISLTRHLQDEGRTVYTDNFYTSPILAHYLESKGIYTCGTVRCNRKGFPVGLVKPKNEENRQPRGHMEWRQCGSLIAHSWKDNRTVYYLSTGLVPEQEGLTTIRKKKDGSRVEFPCPPASSQYQKYMGGVDRMDQMTRLNKEKKTMRWYRRGERKLFEISIYNAYIIWETAARSFIVPT
ncbi:piggyBac transposable element-derived protein 3-like [Gigantopelta aegis]|uniref:piggyBac transposable element-derived protein 3-like n=1 Tax=Gigantopelta aegis TaxID=1735272 RepID=UPI001B88E503|nr:piggyBac transposable element-derived protein 3-like [Gigantopelta aegis]